MQELSRSAMFAPLALFCAAIAMSPAAPVRAEPTPADPLPAWRDGAAKTRILDFVARVTTPGSKDYLPVEDRIATFDNDGTLWPEQPIIQVVAMRERLRTLAKTDPSLADKQPYKAALEGDTEYFRGHGEGAVMQVVGTTLAGETDEAYEAESRRFLTTERHPTLGVPYVELAYRPMVELLGLLRAHGFQTWICSSGDIDFMRTVSQQMYGIPPEHVIGSSMKKELVDRGGTATLLRNKEMSSFNDNSEKPVNIDLHIGRRPAFAAGNVRSGGDIAMLEYTDGRRGPSLELMILHDDPKREFAYQEKNNASLDAAHARGWAVVSIQNDWRAVFDDAIRPQ